MGTLVGSSTGYDGANTTTVATAALAVTTGNLIVVIFSTQEDGGQTWTCADTAGNTYSKTADFGTSGARCTLFYRFNATGHAANVATVTSSSAHRYKNAVQLHISGIATASALDDSDGSDQAGSTVATTANMTCTAAGILVYGVCSTNDRSWTQAGGSTEVYDTAAGIAVYYRNVTAGTVTGSATASGSSNLASVGAIFLDAGGGGGAVLRRNSLLRVGVGR